ncbi:TPA: hypothetical protein IGZ65_004286 [Escherichia coli]|nr:hypothetical protein [Escherichia coli]
MFNSVAIPSPSRLHSGAIEQLFQYSRINEGYSESEHLKLITENLKLLDEGIHLIENTGRILSVLTDSDEDAAAEYVRNLFDTEINMDMFCFIRDHMEKQIAHSVYSDAVNDALGEYLDKIYVACRASSFLCMLAKQFMAVKYRDAEHHLSASDVENMKKRIESSHEELGLEPPVWK